MAQVGILSTSVLKQLFKMIFFEQENITVMNYIYCIICTYNAIIKGPNLQRK